MLAGMLRLQLVNCPEADAQRKASLQSRLDWALHRLTQIEPMLKMIDELEQLVLDEAKPDWDWKAGIEAQLEIRRKQHTLQQQMVPQPGTRR